MEQAEEEKVDYHHCQSSLEVACLCRCFAYLAGAPLILFYSFVFPFLSLTAYAAEELVIDDGRHHIYADRTIYHVDEKVYEAFGNVVLSAKDKRVSAKYVWIDAVNFEVKLRGDVVYAARQAIIYSQEMHMNLRDGTGSVFNGRVVSDQYLLKGQLIRKISDNRFLVTRGEYTTCKDCPESWKFVAKSIDLTIEGYAYLSDVYIHVKDSPVFYFPYLIVPVKTKRQTGFLFPKIGFNSDFGFTYTQPFFWAISDHQDLTLTYKELLKQETREGFTEDVGWASEIEHNYRYYWGLQGKTNFHYFKDGRQFLIERAAKENNKSVLEDRDSVGVDRYAFRSEHDLPLSEKFDVKLLVREVRDNQYINEFPEHIYPENPGKKTLPAIESNLTVQSSWERLYLSAQLKRYRNVSADSVRQLDRGTVNTLPSLFFGYTQHPLFAGVLGGIAARYDNFYREKESFEDLDGDRIHDATLDETDGEDIGFIGQPEFLRQAQRFIFEPELTLPIHLGSAFNIAPSLKFSHINYIFNIEPTDTSIQNTSRQFLTLRVNSSTLLEKVWDITDPDSDYDKIKHQISPFIEYVTIPYKQEDQNHVYSRQIRLEGGKFDSFDVIPVSIDDDELKRPIGNAIRYGFFSRVILRSRDTESEARFFPYDLARPFANSYVKPSSRKEELKIAKDVLWDLYAPNYSYTQVWRLSVENSFNIREWNRNRASAEEAKNLPNGRDLKRPFGNFDVRSDFNINKFSHNLNYRILPYQSATQKRFRHEVSTGFGYTLKSLANRRGTLSVNRSIAAGFSFFSKPKPAKNVNLSLTWSFNDYLTFNGSFARDLQDKNTRSWSTNFVYNAPSECWNIQFGLNYTRGSDQTNRQFKFEVGVNLLGGGYIGAQSTAAGAGSFIPGGI